MEFFAGMFLGYILCLIVSACIEIKESKNNKAGIFHNGH